MYNVVHVVRQRPIDFVAFSAFDATSIQLEDNAMSCQTNADVKLLGIIDAL